MTDAFYYHFCTLKALRASIGTPLKTFDNKRPKKTDMLNLLFSPFDKRVPR
jgi:hypothetical protein